MKTPSPGEIPTTFGDPRRPRVIDESAMDFSALDRLVEEPPSDKPALPRTPSARAAIASVPNVARQTAVAAVRAAAPPAVAATAPAAARAVAPSQRLAVSSLLIGLLLLLAIGEAAAIVMLLRRPLTPAPADSGSLAIATVPSGARVIVDDTDRGATPLTLALPAGAHRAVLALGSQRREISVDVAAGGSYAHHLEFASGSAAAASSGANGAVKVVSRPSGASVLIAGTVRGRTPVTVSDLPPGTHEVLLNLGRHQLKESVTVQSGVTAQLSAAFPATSSSGAAGWIAIASPVELTILEDGQVLGTTRSSRIMVPAGRHALELANERLGFRTSRVLDVDDGKTVSFTPELPKGSASVNALPWAEVWVEDRKVGDTPLANLSLPIGNHQLVFRHPSLGERRQDVTITASAATRVSVDMRK
jgi:hypothetical protein